MNTAAVQLLVGLPQTLWGPVAGRATDSICQGADVLVAKPVLVGLAVEELESINLILVLRDVALE